MDIRKIGSIAAVIAAFGPSISGAAPESTALHACARAFATSIADPGAGVPKYRLDLRGDQFVGSTLEFYAREYRFDLQARDPKTGAVIARATCSADYRGIVALSPAVAEHAALTTQF